MPLPKVNLFTADGHFVSEESILPYVYWPESVCWGLRMFVANNVTADERKAGIKPDYYEVDGMAAVGFHLTPKFAGNLAELLDVPTPAPPAKPKGVAPGVGGGAPGFTSAPHGRKAPPEDRP